MFFIFDIILAVIDTIMLIAGFIFLAVIFIFIVYCIHYVYDITPLWVLVSVGTFLILLAFGFFLNWYKEKKGRCFLGLKY